MKVTRLLLPAFAFLALFVSAPAQQMAKVPEGTKALLDLAYVAHAHEHQKLDLYLPEKAGGPTPLVIWIHGGGWIGGDKKEGNPFLNGGYTQRGYAVANLNYRLSGDAIFPAQIEDCKAAIRWLRAHAKDYNLDSAHVGVWGSSAGGHLVALLGATGHIKDFDVGENLDQSSAVQAVSDFYGPTDLVQMDAHALAGARLKHDAPNAPEARLVGGPIQEKPFRDLAARVNPIPYLTKDAPPYLIVHGDADPTVPHHQSELLYAALAKVGIPVRFTTVNGGGHGAGFPSKDLNPIVSEFFDRYLKGDKNAAQWPAAMTSEVKATAPQGAAPANTNRGDRPAAANQNGPRNGPPSWEVVAQRDDADHDGRLSRAEFKGPPRLFDQLDANHDGFLTKEEHEDGLRALGRR